MFRLSATAVLVFGFMLVEARRAARNERTQRARGGLAPEGDVYETMRWAYPGVFVAMIIEGGLWPVRWPALIPLGAAVFAVAKALKWWAITTLGSCWTFRLIVVPGTAPIRAGPYRFARHPNYIAVVGEIVGVALVAGARVTGPLSLFAFGALMLGRIAVEDRALDAILPRG